jgi:hypothetical protein
VKEVLVDRGQLVDQNLVEILEDFLVALHGGSVGEREGKL